MALSEQRKQYLREWRAKNRDRVNEQNRAYVKRNPAKRQASSSEWAKKNRAKRRAHGLLGYHVAKGHIDRKPCEQCGDPNSQGHHHDYKKKLDVIWLCSACHGKEHRETT